ncbi:MAG: hypothetical protein LBQ09_07790 [Acidobacteriaceae bacterium]|jgi:hypothetical protein|nr:hypothetical protein [Acidobacteriaceae bacterium]
MRTLSLALLTVLSLVTFTSAQSGSAAGPYKVLKTAKVGGDGGFDYVFADAAARKLYVPRNGADGRVTVFNLDTLQPAGEITKTNARGAAVDSGHGFSSSRPIAMWDSNTLAPIKTIEVQGAPDGIFADPFNHRIWVFSHSAPNATVIDAKDGSIVGTLDLDGAPEQAASDGRGHLYVDLEDKNQVAVIDAAALRVTGRYDISSAAKTPAGLALDAEHHVLFVACRNPQMMVMVNAETGAILASLPIGAGVDGAVFNPATQEAFSSQSDGTLTVIKENSPTSFVVAQTVQTQAGAKTLTLDSKTQQVYLIAADYTSTPPPTPGGRGGRAMVPNSFAVLVVGK